MRKSRKVQYQEDAVRAERRGNWALAAKLHRKLGNTKDVKDCEALAENKASFKIWSARLLAAIKNSKKK